MFAPDCGSLCCIGFRSSFTSCGFLPYSRSLRAPPYVVPLFGPLLCFNYPDEYNNHHVHNENHNNDDSNDND